MNVKLKVLTVGALFFIGGQTVMAQKKKDSLGEKKIDEVVVLGYNKSSTKPKDVSANTTITADVLDSRPNVSFLNSIQGSAPGVTIASNSGSPGSAKIDVIIRGISSINASTEPLVVIDGVPTNANQFRNLNPEDIESVSILRDAAATSIYGNRGANGVLVVKTKQAKFGSGFRFTYSGTTGVSFMPDNRYNIADARELLTIQKRRNVLLGRTLTDAQIADYPIDTNWKDVFFNADLTQQHNLTISSGGENLSNYTSLGYFQQGGLVPNTNFQRFTLRNNINAKSSNNKLTFNAQVGLAFSKRNQLNQETNSGLNGNTIQNPLLGSLMALPYLEANRFKNPGDLFNTIGTNSGGVGNFVYILEDVLKAGHIPNRIFDTNIFTSTTTTYKITDDLSLTNRSGMDFKNTDQWNARAPWSYLAQVVAANASTQYGGFETISNSKEFNFNSVTSANYSKTFGDHQIDLGAYLEYTKVHYLFSSRTQNGLNPLNWALGAGTGYVPYNAADPNKYVPSVSAQKVNAGALAFFGTLDYDYKSKYGFGAVLRRDASYRFAENNKWATFWSVAGRWNIDKENFMEGSVFNLLKLRASYGTQGNANVVAPAAGSNAMLLGTQIVRDLNTVNNGYDNNVGYAVSSIGNLSLQWEEVTQANIGLDFKVFSNKLEGNVDVYRKQTDKLYNDIKSSAITSFYDYRGNLGGLKNEGVEVALRYNIANTKDLRFSLFVNGAYNKNTITDLAVPVLSGSLINEVGGTLNQWNLVRYVGVNPANGNEQFLDANGNLTENPVDADRVKTGKSYFPKYTGGFGLNSEYKGFFLDAIFAFQADLWRIDNQMIWAYNPAYMAAGYNVSADLLNAWTPTNTITDIPALTAPLRSSTSDRFLYDASFLRFKTLSFGYSVPKELLKGNFVKSLKIFVQGENLAVWTKWKGFDPEGLGTFPLSVYPNPRTVSIGTNIEF
jgi:TonB-linked SusC/RagA family outer membrane protein